jgi:lambda repressor-like predicted transcriptional regulator
MHPADIKAALEKAGYSQTRLGHSFQPPRTRMTICNVVHGRTTSLEIARKISDVIGVSVMDLWPGKYDRRLEEEAAARADDQDGAHA